ncbi:hypothetical protein ASE95_00885 [Sphingomonas sp. Leaf231]|uniref:hypothetical protein n=1 Tax=Sphingomonas sp. Leaf231 TaxID=1736301 RepID=UPI0006F6668A|nr:hypothetical protein [Sphingomonas sp. Leaf231]KQN93539.1 hypothetical protein ASE95_00885 [Sphingomonas sp. Leaf231]
MAVVAVLWFILQTAVAGPSLDVPRAPGRCGTRGGGGGSDIVVCGRRTDQDSFRLRPLEGRYTSDPAALPKAETRILGGRAALAAEAESATVGGVQSNRAMLRLKIPLGKLRD